MDRRWLMSAMMMGVVASLLVVLGRAGNETAHAGYPTALAPSLVTPSGHQPLPLRPIRVVCTTAMVADLVRNVGGDHVEVQTLLGERVDPHTYKPVLSDLNRLQSAEMIFYSGLHLEGKMGRLLHKLESQRPTVAVAESLPHSRRLAEDDTGTTDDPHVWFDVAAWADCLPAVRDALTRYAPQHADEFAANASRYHADLLALDAEVRTAIATIPPERRVLITSHDAFRYFGRAYGIEVAGIQGLSTESEAGVHEINALVNRLVEQRIPAVFVETSISDRNMMALLEGCAAKGHAVRLGGRLYSDAMGHAGTTEGTYPGMIRANVQALVSALGGTDGTGLIQR
ncbi:metal ABC transporter solute-binding protein, Zn/Mn family [Tuwongella immobilis]|uniref:Manganese transporter n=1 Tax=Tuwongella immobilis TaxID=692036 RepID=A0A6C2YN90_9BACT|nr:zinc ABC transporter substrate-binding protein [Tuwongella immobilis]VIP02362.1 manganese transporter : Periplasmic solute binding protein OS=Pirellula staleyi (strain ATCC 27377 / DSM 6068 / ICPB 4128) GN=Psta_4674 PE=3 SV=1: TroA [Tuwongella immobilis]VTS01172.1 manganese transporter : Periplasmic solute binding protein OS=Pirellula staleyi (strain ATCC 27377 / DSM 6068 / ICPB 4128) GN=Psta_4674 PE=3 SV=1: TroA [Tuwongella immobilis]